MHRRTLLTLPVLGAAGLALTACGEDAPVPKADRTGKDRISYGTDASQFGELYLPTGTPRGVVVVIHGGFWLDQYDYTLGSPLATSLAAEGWAAWNLEYRRTGSGGGDPATFDDVAAGIDKLRDLDLDLTRVITLGHSAGGHLSTWAASRGRFEQWAGGVAITHVISQAGVLDLVTADADGLGGGAVQRFLGHPLGPDDAPLDPAQQVPLDVPVFCVHGDSDQNVPITQSEQYVGQATAAGATASLTRVDGDHFVVIDPTSAAWSAQLALLDSIG